MGKLKIALVIIFALTLATALLCGPAFAAGVRVVPSTASVAPGSDLYFDVLVEGIPADGLGGVQFRLTVTAPGVTVAGVTDLSQAGAVGIAVATPLLISPPTATRSGIGDFFWNGLGVNGILVMDNETLTNGSALFTFAHTNGAIPPTGSGSVARFMVRVGSGVTANRIDISLSDVMLLDGGPVYSLDYNTGVSVPILCVTKTPSLLGLGLSQAQAALAAANLVLGTVYEVDNLNGTLPLNLVLEQSSAAGSSLSCQSPVNLAINTPPAFTLNPVLSPTTVASQTLGGTMVAGATISVSAGGMATVGMVTYPTATSWSCSIGNLAAGNNTVTATAADSHGNKGTISTTIEYRALAASVTPISIPVGYQGNIVLNVTNISSPGSDLLVEQYVDANHNGIIDSGDYLIRSFKVTDGVASANPNIQGDEDAAADGAVTTSLNYFLTTDLYHAPGNYLFRVTSGSNIITVPFTVTPVTGGQSVSGVVTDGTKPVPGAMVRLQDKWQRTIAIAIADISGQYTLNVKDPGDYYIVPAAYGYGAASASIFPVTVASGQNVTGSNLTLTAGTYHLTGQVKDDTSGVGVPGVWVEAKGLAFSGVAVTDPNGNYDLLLPGGSYTVSDSTDINGPAPFAKGYAVFAKQPVNINLTADTGGQDISLTKGAVLVKGQVVDQTGQGVSGLPIQGEIWGTVDARKPVALGVTDGNGNYTLGLYNAENWNVFPKDASAQIRGYVGNIIRDLSTTTGPLSGNNLTVNPVTAWVQGTVKDANGNFLADTEVRIRTADSSQLAIIRTGTDGTYRLGTYAGDWLVNALTADKGFYPVLERNVTLADGQSATIDFTADVNLPSLTPAALANGGYSLPYSQAVNATGGLGPYRYSITAGVLPDGLSLDAATGVISGTPTASDATFAFTVRATDANGLTADQAYTVTIFGIPIVTITSPVAGFTNNNKPPLNYTASSGTVAVKVDGVAVSKISGQTLDPLSDTAHTVEVDVTNPVGVTASASVTFTVKTVPPTVTITSPVAGYTNNKTPVVNYIVSDGTVTVKVDGTIVAKTSGQALDPLADGSHTVLVQSTDAAVNTGSASVTFTVITVPPSVTVNPVTTPTKATSQTLTGTVGSGATIAVTATTAASIGTITYPTSTTWTCAVTNLIVGNNTFTVTATDQAGNSSTTVATITYNPPMSATISPATITNTYQGNVALAIGNLTTAGSTVFVEQFVDANNNGVIDAGDFVVRSFNLTDGTASANLNVQGDEDGAVNSAISTTLNYYLLNDLYHAPGQYIFRVTSGADTATASLVVSQEPQPQSISGAVTANASPAPGAIVQLTDKWQRPVAFTLADNTGHYTLNVNNAGNYLITPAAYGYAGSASAPVTLAAGQTITGNDLTLSPGVFHVTGLVNDETTGTGIDGIWVKAAGTNGNGVAISGATGNFDLFLPGGQYSIAVAADPTVPNPSSKGYLGFGNLPANITVSTDVSGTNLALPQGGTLVSGNVVNGQGTVVPGLPVQGKLPASADTRVPVGYGVTNATGDYTLALIPGTTWNLALNDPVAQILDYIGNYIGAFSTSNTTLTGNNLTVQPITAWVMGTVSDSAGNLVAGGDIRLRNGDSSIESTITSAPDGTYRIGAFAGNWFIDDVTHNKGNQTLEQAVALVDWQTATVDFVVDVTPPTLAINPVTTPTISNSQTIAGTVEAGSTITVSVDTSAAVGTVSYPTQSTWNCTVSGLVTGDNNIVITATDSAGNTTTATTRITLLQTYAIMASSDSNGSILPSGLVTVISGSSQTFTVTPNAGYAIANITVDGVSQGAITSYTFTNVTAVHTITASFAVNAYTITASTGSGGSISPSGTVTVTSGGNQIFTITPNTNYHVANVMVDGVSQGTITSYVFTSVTAAHTIAATFAINSFNIIFNASSGGSITGTPNQTVDYGGSMTAVTAVPTTGYHFVNWTGTNGFVTTTANPLTVTNVTVSQNVTANFAINTYNLSFSADTGGSLTGTANQVVNYGGNSTAVTAVPAIGYKFINWTGTNGFVTSTANPLTVTNVTASQSITANFTPATLAKSWTGNYTMGYGGAPDRMGNYYFAGYLSTNYVYQVNGFTGSLNWTSTTANSGGGGVITDTGGNVYSQNVGTGKINKFTPPQTTPVWTTTLPNISAGVNCPAMAIDRNGYLYVVAKQQVQFVTGPYFYIYKIQTSTGNIVWTGTTSLGSTAMTGLVVDSQGKIYVSSIASPATTVYKFDPSISATPVASFTYTSARYLAIDSTDSIYVSGNSTLYKIDTNGNVYWSITPNIAAPTAVATDGTNVYIGFYQYLSVYDASTGSLKQTFSNVPNAGFNASSWISTDGTGGVYVHSAIASGSPEPVTKYMFQ